MVRRSGTRTVQRTRVALTTGTRMIRLRSKRQRCPGAWGAERPSPDTIRRARAHGHGREMRCNGNHARRQPPGVAFSVGCHPADFCRPRSRSTRSGCKLTEFSQDRSSRCWCRVAPDHDRRTFGDAPVALPQMARVASREIDQFFQRAMAQSRFSMVGGASPRSVGSGANCKYPQRFDPFYPSLPVKGINRPRSR